MWSISLSSSLGGNEKWKEYPNSSNWYGWKKVSFTLFHLCMESHSAVILQWVHRVNGGCCATFSVVFVSLCFITSRVYYFESRKMHIYIYIYIIHDVWLFWILTYTRCKLWEAVIYFEFERTNFLCILLWQHQWCCLGRNEKRIHASGKWEKICTSLSLFPF